MVEVTSLEAVDPGQDRRVADAPIKEEARLRFDPSAYVQEAEGEAPELFLLIENMHCGGCVRRIEGALGGLDGVTDVRANLTTRRVRVAFDDVRIAPSGIVDAVVASGYHPVPFDPALLEAASDSGDKALLRAMAVAGFAAANVMLLSVSVWAGQFSGDMGPATRDLLHWISAMIALPAIAYAGRPFFGSAIAALRARQMNMDVPISLAVLLAATVSLVQTAEGGEHAYFDASVMLIFFLLIGRYLDRQARGKARAAAEELMLLGAVAATVIDEDGRQRSLPVEEVRPGMKVLALPGDRIPVDGRVVTGRSMLDTSLVTGESLPVAIAPGQDVFAGTLNIDAPLTISVTASGEGTLLAEIVRLLEVAQEGKAHYRRLADRLAKVYSPAVHLLALAAFLGWLLIAGADWRTSLMVAVAVLIITCPCALALAIPTVQVVASGRLLKRGVLLKSADGLERLAEADTVVFDKTGTLTFGRPELVNRADIAEADMRTAGLLAASSRHPLAKALARAAGPQLHSAEMVREEPGMGIEGMVGGERVRLGNAAWCGATREAAEEGPQDGSEIWFRCGGAKPVRFAFEDSIRPDAQSVVAELTDRGYRVALLSGDRPGIVARVGELLRIPQTHAELLPTGKVSRIEELARNGRSVVMVGDGLNDAPALAAAHVSISPATAADISRTAADFVFQGDRLQPIVEALTVAKEARRLMVQNFALALIYNAVAVPLAMAGMVTPLIAAVAMSTSSILVTLNALRLRLSPSGR